MNNRSRSTQQLKRADKVLRAFEMRMKGYTLQDCADELGVTTPTITNYVREELENRLTPLADVERRKQLEQLDMLIKKVWAIIENDEPLYQYGKLVYASNGTVAVDTKRTLEATAEMRKLLDSRARLTGAYKPFQTQTEVTHTTPADKALDSLVAQMEARNLQVQAELVS
jgi:predicted transcriptional regulator